MAVIIEECCVLKFMIFLILVHSYFFCVLVFLFSCYKRETLDYGFMIFALG